MDAPSLRLSLTAAAFSLLAACSTDARPPVLTTDADTPDTVDAQGDVSDATPQDVADASDAAPQDVADVSDAAADATDASDAAADATDASDAGSDAATDASDAGSDAATDATDAGDAARMDAPTEDAPATDAAGDAATDAAPDVPPDVFVCAGTTCGVVCVNTVTDTHHCGDCATDCAALPGVRADAVVCAASRCDVSTACVTGRAHCTAGAADGCETDVTTTSNCGRCGAACAARPNATATCTSGTCGMRCATNFCDGDGDASNGCEADTRTTVAHCGACGHACPAVANATATCAAGACGFTCAANFGDCDGDASNGCETDLRTSLAHCGACRNTCPTVSDGHATCAASACGLVCDAGFTLSGGRCEPPPPRLVHPMSTATVSSLRPTLRFRAWPGAEGTRVQVCADRACLRIDATLDVTTESARPTTVLAPGVHFWRAQSLRGGATVGPASAIWEFVVGRLDTPIDSSWGTLPDVNGDGFGDAIVGSQGAEVRVFHGGATGLSTTAAAVLHPPDGETTFGFAVQSAGDVNGDGYADVVVGSRGSGAAYVYHGGPTGISTTPATTLSGMVEASYGEAVTSVGDMNQDGYGDIAIAAPGMPLMGIPGLVFVYRGGPAGIDPATRTVHNPGETVLVFGFTISSGGDVNGDGYEDLLAGAPGYLMTSTGTMYVFYGSAAGFGAVPNVRYAGTAGGYYGFPVAQVGDLNADGYADIATAMTYYGRVLVYHGGPSGPSPTANRTLQVFDVADFGRYISSGGDVNADGYGDMLVGADYFSQVHVYYGSTTGIPASDSALLSGTAGSNFGRAVTSIGDSNGDGFPDVLVGAPTASRALLFLSTGPRGLSTTAAATLTSTATDFGYSLGGL